MDPIRNIIKVRVNNQDYLYQYENAWDKEKQRSYSKHRTTVGKLVNPNSQNIAPGFFHFEKNLS